MIQIDKKQLKEIKKIVSRVYTLADKIDDLQARSDWHKVSKEIYKDHKTEINREIRIELESW